MLHELCAEKCTSCELLVLLSEQTVRQHEAAIRCVEFCPDVNAVITGSWDMRVKLWDPRTPREAGSFKQPDRVLTSQA